MTDLGVWDGVFGVSGRGCDETGGDGVAVGVVGRRDDTVIPRASG